MLRLQRLDGGFQLFNLLVLDLCLRRCVQLALGLVSTTFGGFTGLALLADRFVEALLGDTLGGELAILVAGLLALYDFIFRLVNGGFCRFVCRFVIEDVFHLVVGHWNDWRFDEVTACCRVNGEVVDVRCRG